MIYLFPMRIHLLDSLSSLHNGPIEVIADSVAEAISALRLHPAFDPKSGKKYHVAIDGFESRDAIYDKTDVQDIFLRPVMAGSGKGGWTQIVIGIVIIAAAVSTGGLAGLTVAGSGGLTAAGSVAMAGAMMVLGGIMQLMAPQPRIGANAGEEKSRYLGGGQNTVAIGTPIPMIYGRMKAWGHYLSFNLDAGEMNKAPASWYASPFTNTGTLNYSAADPTIPLSNQPYSNVQVTATYTGLSYPSNMDSTGDSYINFTPATLLAAGGWDATFPNGETYRVTSTGGSVTQVTVKTGNVAKLPANGALITFTRNYG